jgi:capsular polysaccharide biosynthesis protein
MENRKELQFKDIIQLLKQKWWLILLLTTIGLGTSFLFSTQIMTPIYESETVLFIGNENTGLGSVDISLGTLNADSQLIVDYQQIALTRLVIGAVIQNTNLNISYEDFRENVVIQTVSDSRLFTVGYRDPDPIIAQTVSDELAKQLSLAVFEIVGVENIRILDQAQIPQEPVSPNVLLLSLLGALAGLIISIMIIAILHLLDDTVKSETDVENLLGTTVLGSIPKFKTNTDF